MRHIGANNITSISADYADGNLPASNLLTPEPRVRYSAGGTITNATITAEISGGVSDIAIIGTNAQELSFTVYDPNQIEFEDGDDWEDGDEWVNTDITVTGTVTKREKSKSMWLQLSEPVTVPCFADIHLTAPGNETLYAGIMLARIANDYGGAHPKYSGFKEGRDDSNSVMIKNPSGSAYYKLRNPTRPFSFDARMLTTEFHKLTAFFDQNGMAPSAWLLTDDGNTEFIIYGRTSVSGEHRHLHHTEASISIEEVV